MAKKYANQNDTHRLPWSCTELRYSVYKMHIAILYDYLKELAGTMGKFSLLIMATTLLLSHITVANAGNYEVSLTRKSSNVYKVDGQDIIIQTRYCYVYAYSEEAIFKSSGYGGEVFFFGSKDKCDVKAVFGAAHHKPGKYAVTVSREEDDWYEIFGANAYIKTSSCLSLTLGEEAILNLVNYGVGTLRFRNGFDCMVEGVYTKLRF